MSAVVIWVLFGSNQLYLIYRRVTPLEQKSADCKANELARVTESWLENMLTAARIAFDTFWCPHRSWAMSINMHIYIYIYKNDWASYRNTWGAHFCALSQRARFWFQVGPMPGFKQLTYFRHLRLAEDPEKTHSNPHSPPSNGQVIRQLVPTSAAIINCGHRR